jgi:hypothetical protein
MALQKTLTTPYSVAGTVYKLEVDSFAFNIADGLVHIGYSMLADDDSVIRVDVPHTLSGQEYTDFVARVAVLDDTLSATQSIITACLEFLPGAGTIA